jgi:hypothetical protein
MASQRELKKLTEAAEASKKQYAYSPYEHAAALLFALALLEARDEEVLVRPAVYGVDKGSTLSAVYFDADAGPYILCPECNRKAFLRAGRVHIIAACSDHTLLGTGYVRRVESGQITTLLKLVGSE